MPRRDFIFPPQKPLPPKSRLSADVTPSESADPMLADTGVCAPHPRRCRAVSAAHRHMKTAPPSMPFVHSHYHPKETTMTEVAQVVCPRAPPGRTRLPLIGATSQQSPPPPADPIYLFHFNDNGDESIQEFEFSGPLGRGRNGPHWARRGSIRFHVGRSRMLRFDPYFWVDSSPVPLGISIYMTGIWPPFLVIGHVKGPDISRIMVPPLRRGLAEV
jgi:hypothetical protein